MPRQQRVFLSYAREDLDTIQKLYDDLKEREVNVWLDKVDLAPGRWKPQIELAIAESTHFVICLSWNALPKTRGTRGFMGEELNMAWEIAKTHSESEFIIIPIRLENCDRDDHRLSFFQQYDLFEDWEGVLDRLAIHLGGTSLADKQAIDERSEDEKVTDHLYAKASAFYFAGEYDKAHRLLDTIVSIGPGSARIWINKAVTLDRLQRYDEALEAYDAALAIDPRNASAWFNRGATLEQKALQAYDARQTAYGIKLEQEAIQAYAKAHHFAPNFTDAWFNKGTVLGRLGQHHEAIQAYEKALTLDPNHADAWFNKGNALRKLDRYAEALAAYNKALAINPHDTTAWISKGMTLDHFQRYPEALDAFDQALTIDPGNAMALHNKRYVLNKLAE